MTRHSANSRKWNGPFKVSSDPARGTFQRIEHGAPAAQRIVHQRRGAGIAAEAESTAACGVPLPVSEAGTLPPRFGSEQTGAVRR